MRSTTDTSNASDLTPGAAPLTRDSVLLPRRWTLHGLNNGTIFSATHAGVTRLPRRVSYAISHAATYAAWRTLTETRRAIAANLAAILPGESTAALERRALTTLRSYAADVIDFLRALDGPAEDAARCFRPDDSYLRLFERLHQQGRGTILVSGHYGNWEIGGLLITRVLRIPLTLVAMEEPDPQVREIRRRLRERVGADTVIVRQSLDTALQIRRRLADNHMVAMLIDRHYGRDRVQVTMFGRRVWFLRTPLLMAHATGAPLLPCFIERAGPGDFVASPAQEIYVRRDVPREQALAEAAQQVADSMAERIRRRPELWYHFYRYWDAQNDSYDGLV